MSKNKEKRVAKSNKLIEGAYKVKGSIKGKFKYKISITQAKILTKLASQINSYEDKKFETYTFNARELLEELKLGEENFTFLRNNIQDLMMTIITIRQEDGFLDLTLLNKAKYYDDGVIDLSFSEEVKPFFLEIKDNLTTYEVKNITNLKSFYSYRLYELLKQYEKIRKRVFTIQDLRYSLGIEDKEYTKYNDFKKRVIQQAQKELKEKCDIYFEYKEHKTGRKITSITFHIISKSKEQEQKQLEQPKTEYKAYKVDSFLLEKIKSLRVKESEAIKICKMNSEGKILRNLEYTNEQKSKGKVKESLAGFFISALKNDWGGGQTNFDDLEKKEDRQQSTETNKQTQKETGIIQTEKYISSIENQEQLIKNKFEIYKNDKVRTYLEEHNNKRNDFIKEFIQANYKEKPVKLIIDFMKIDIKNIDNSKIDKLRTILNNPNEHFKIIQVGLKLASKTFINLFVDYILISKLHLNFEIYKSIIKS